MTARATSVPPGVVEALSATVAAAAGIAREAMGSRVRTPDIVAARQQLIRDLFAAGYKPAAIARAVGRDHSTIVYLLGHTAIKGSHKQHPTAPTTLPSEHWLRRGLPAPASVTRCADPDEVAKSLSGLSDTQRRQVAAYLAHVLLADRPRHSAETLNGLRLLARCPQHADQAAHYLVNTDTLTVGRQYWRDSAIGILTRMQLQARQVDIRWATLGLSPAPMPIPPKLSTGFQEDVVAKKEKPMPRIELIDPTQVPSSGRTHADSRASLEEATSWLEKAQASSQALVLRLEKDERADNVRKTFHDAAKAMHIEIRLVSGPQTRTYTSRSGKQASEPTTLYVRVTSSAAPAKLERVS